MASKEKGDYPDIYDELARIRRDADDGLNPHVLAGSPVLCKLMGNGDPFLATGELRDRISTAAANGDRSILAFYYSLFPGKDATDRLIEMGNKLSVEYRRARDLSDQGVLKLSQIIGSDQEWQVPFMGCSLTIHDWEATVEGYVIVANGFRKYDHPRFLVNGETVETEHERLDDGNWERHQYAPFTIALDRKKHRIQMRRIGTPKIRVNMTIRSNNPNVVMSSSLVLLDYVADLTVTKNSAVGTAAGSSLD